MHRNSKTTTITIDITSNDNDDKSSLLYDAAVTPRPEASDSVIEQRGEKKATGSTSTGKIASGLESSKPKTPPKPRYFFIRTEAANQTVLECSIDGNGRTVINRLFSWVESLIGRGQAGVAGFYKEKVSKKQYLIKQDKLATCVLEGSAGFAEYLIPHGRPGLKSAVNFAYASRWKQTPDAKEVAVTVQPRLEGYQPWAEVMTGKRRKAKSPISFEALNRTTIRGSIRHMSRQAKYELATAIYLSEVVGDESLHVGQFMVQVGADGLIGHITRVDFGARERFAALRMQNKDNHPGETSTPYRKSGQFGKSYICYLLRDPDIRAKYLELWARDINNPEELAKRNREAVRGQLNNIPEADRYDALDGIKSTLKGGKDKNFRVERSPAGEESVLKLLEQTTKARIEQMRAQNTAALYQDFTRSLQLICQHMPPLQEPVKTIVLKQTDPGSSLLSIDFASFLQPENFQSLVQAILSISRGEKKGMQPISAPVRQELTQAVKQLLCHLEANLKFSLQTDADSKVDPERQKQFEIIHDMRHNFRVQERVLKELESYAKSLDGFWLYHSPKHKIPSVKDVIKKIRDGVPINEVISEEFLHRIGTVNRTGDAGVVVAGYLRESVKRYVEIPFKPKMIGNESHRARSTTIDLLDDEFIINRARTMSSKSG